MPLNVRDDPRLAGEVQRYHTWPSIRKQTVAEHTWQVLRILLTIAPERTEMWRYVVIHDLGEITTGDLPYPIKKDNPVLAEYIGDLEYKTLYDFKTEWRWGRVPDLSVIDNMIFKTAEYIEMWEWAMEERLLGNQYAALVEQRMYDMAQEKAGELSANGLHTEHNKAVFYMDKRSMMWQKISQVR